MCAEPYMKLSDAAKSTQRITQQTPLLCSRLGYYHMPFAWAARWAIVVTLHLRHGDTYTFSKYSINVR